MHLLFYLLFSLFASPFVGGWLKRRLKRGKEDEARLNERLGYSRQERPAGKLVWVHAASVGESVSILKLLERITATAPHLHVLVTTGTVTSANLMEKRLPARCLHQYAPVDTPFAVQRFLEHWKPDSALFVESELWPNLILSSFRMHIPLALVNGRMSERSFAKWQKRGTMAHTLLQCFGLCLAQSEGDRKRFEQLGARNTGYIGNLKFDAALLPDDAPTREALEKIIGSRPVWVAASTHPGEEEQVAEAHAGLLKQHPNLLLILIPRHPTRGPELKATLAKDLSVALRSVGEPITPQTQLYIADTIGELGIFYRLSRIVFMGGSLVPHGGQNPLEPARLECALVTGPHTHNFPDIYDALHLAGAVVRVGTPESLKLQVQGWLEDAARLEAASASAKAFMERSGAIVEHYLTALAPYLPKDLPAKGQSAEGQSAKGTSHGTP